MDKINILVLSDAGAGGLARIAAVSPRLNVIDASKIWAGVDHTGARHQNTSETELHKLLADTDVIYGFTLPPDIIARAPRLKWIHVMIAGVDRVLTPELIHSPVIMTTSQGIHGTPVGETVMGMVFLFARRLAYCLENQRLKQWQRFTPPILREQTVGILGLGAIGNEIARMCKTFGMRVIGLRRSIKRETRSRYADRVLPAAGLTELLAESDYVINVLPLTPETDGLIGEKELRTMKQTAYFINVGRGRTVDEDALVRALEQGWIAGAGLDAFTVEPLPADSRLWTAPSVFISPHIGGTMQRYNELATGVFCENLERYLSGKRLKNLVNKKKGY